MFKKNLLLSAEEKKRLVNFVFLLVKIKKHPALVKTLSGRAAKRNPTPKEKQNVKLVSNGFKLLVCVIGRHLFGLPPLKAA